ncbi:MAG: triose-phosphate isomerase [Anaerolineae bacterium]|nr:triose-phosphate isomerase [Anaerolineae bacterium]
MRTPIIAGNWKMNKAIEEAVNLVREMRPGLNEVPGVDKVLCPPFTALAAVKELLEPTAIKLGAQNMHWEEKGAYTGEISPLMLKKLCQYVILGHSERRQYFGETDDRVNKKMKAALAYDLIPIVCVGENLAQNEAGQTQAVVGGQVRGCLADLSAEQVRGLIIAYEPIWAIGTGRPATGAGANAVIGQSIRGTISDLYDKATAQAVRVQYGGSVNPKNIAEFMSQVDIDGALVGGASLKAADFVEIVRISAQVKHPLSLRGR